MLEFLKKTFHDNDGTPSYRHMTTFFFVLLGAYAVLFKIPERDMLNAFMYILLFILVISGYITADNILSKFLSKK